MVMIFLIGHVKSGHVGHVKTSSNMQSIYASARGVKSGGGEFSSVGNV